MKQQIQYFLKRQYPGIVFDVSYPPEGFGDYSTNIAFLLAKSRSIDISIYRNIDLVAEEVIEKLKNKFSAEFEKIETAKNGFINFYLAKEYLLKGLIGLIGPISPIGPIGPIGPKRINLEFVSANPTGPLTLGNARSAAFGDALASILEKTGHKVTREYYINDIGNQVDLLAESVRRRIRQLEGEQVDFSAQLYQGDYIVGLAKQAKKEKIPQERLKEFAVEKNLDEIKKSLANFGVKFDVWFRESTLISPIGRISPIQDVLNYLESSGLAYKKDGALWFKGTEFGLDKDVVLIKSNGQGTYLLSDFAYAKNKLSRNFNISIYILGADHHDDVKRLKAGIRALGLPEEKFVFLLHQLVALKKGDDVLRMAKRKGIYVSLDDLLGQIPKDVARYFFLEKSLDTHLDFDLVLAKEQSSKNPVFYIQYAFARINSVFSKSPIGSGLIGPISPIGLIGAPEELALIRHLVRFPEIIFEISQNYQVHHLPQYAFELANRFHKFYETRKIISEDEKLTQARLGLVKAVQNVLGEGLRLMGLSAPEKM